MRIRTAITAVCLLAALTACGSNAATDDKASATPSTSSTAEAAASKECADAVFDMLINEVNDEATSDTRPEACDGLTDKQWETVVDEQGEKALDVAGSLEDSLTEDSSDNNPDPGTVGPGTYLVGEDIEPGTYKTAGPDEGGACYWARKKDDSGELESIIANNLSEGPVRVTVTDGEVFETNGCQDWQLAK